jgi:hypothetical protein
MPMVCHEATQLRMSSCHQVSQGVERSTSVESVVARFMVWEQMVQSADKGHEKPRR